MSRITYRGRNQWSSNGRPAGHGLPMAPEPFLVRLTTIAGKSIALGAALYFAAQLLRAVL